MKYINRQAFTMIELVFVIVILGILAAVAIPKLAATRVDAQISKGRADVASIRSAIVNERQTRLIKGDSTFMNSLSSSTTTLFDGNGTTGSELLMYGVTASTEDGHWSTDDTAAPFKSYIYKVGGKSCNFTYDPTTGKFTLDSNQDSLCSDLVK
jgi:general secretion pathway protein G